LEVHFELIERGWVHTRPDPRRLRTSEIRQKHVGEQTVANNENLVRPVRRERPHLLETHRLLLAVPQNPHADALLQGEGQFTGRIVGSVAGRVAQDEDLVFLVVRSQQLLPRLLERGPDLGGVRLCEAIVLVQHDVPHAIGHHELAKTADTERRPQQIAAPRAGPQRVPDLVAELK